MLLQHLFCLVIVSTSFRLYVFSRLCESCVLSCLWCIFGDRQVLERFSCNALEAALFRSRRSLRHYEPVVAGMLHNVST